MDRTRARQKPRDEVGESDTGVRMATHESTKAPMAMAPRDELDRALTELAQRLGDLGFVVNIILELRGTIDHVLSWLPDELCRLQATIGHVIEAAGRHGAGEAEAVDELHERARRLPPGMEPLICAIPGEHIALQAPIIGTLAAPHERLPRVMDGLGPDGNPSTTEAITERPLIAQIAAQDLQGFA